MQQRHAFFFLLLISNILLSLSFSPLYLTDRKACRSRRVHNASRTVTKALGGIAEKMGGIVELLSGQSTITESNIEDTLKVMRCIRYIPVSRHSIAGT